MTPYSAIQERIRSSVGDGDILLIVPPFGSIYDVSLGPHLLQALARQQGQTVDILYLNMFLALVLGTDRYDEIYDAPLFLMLGERLFARSAYGMAPLGRHPEWCADEAMAISGEKTHPQLFYHPHQPFDLQKTLELEQRCVSFLEQAVKVISSLNYKIVGCTSSHTGQTNCGVALLNGIKRQNPGVTTIIGGGNCQREVTEGIATLSDAIDYVFSGESESAFLSFLTAYAANRLPSQRILRGEPLNDLDHSPLADYTPFFQQYTTCFGEDSFDNTRLWYETSRGCWWAQRSTCSFCSEHHIAYRQKSAERVIHDIERITTVYPHKMLFITDILMPQSYQQELLPIIREKHNFPPLTYMVRSHPDLQELIRMKQARIETVLAGIESLSTNLLKLMNKGISARQNLLFLRNAASLGIYVDWFLLWGFPGDSGKDYEDMVRLLPLIRHLQAPRMFFPMTLERFSAYLENRQQYGIMNVRPWAVFTAIYPEWAEIEKLAPYYIGDIPCESYQQPELIQALAREVAVWKKTWKTSQLCMEQVMDAYIIHDTRDVQPKKKLHVLDGSQARDIMTSQVYHESSNLSWAVEEKFGTVVDGWYVPFVTAAPELLLEFETI